MQQQSWSRAASCLLLLLVISSLSARTSAGPAAPQPPAGSIVVLTANDLVDALDNATITRIQLGNGLLK